MDNLLTFLTKYLHIILPSLTFLGGIALVIPKIRKYKKILHEALEVLKTVGQALSDKKITKDELTNIISECKDVVTAIKELRKKVS